MEESTYMEATDMMENIPKLVSEEENNQLTQDITEE